MAKTATIRARIEPDVKEQAEAILRELGISSTEAVSLFYRQIIQKKGLPFEARIPNATTRKAIRDAEAGRNLLPLTTYEDWIKKYK